MKYLILFILIIPNSCYSQEVKRYQSGPGIFNDTLNFQSFSGINYDTSYYNIDIDYPSQLLKFEESKRFKADSNLIKKIEYKISTTYIDCFDTYFIKTGNVLYELDKKRLDSIKMTFQQKYSTCDRRYFGYIDSTGEQNIIVKFIPKGIITPNAPGYPNIRYRTLATLNYNINKGCLWFAK